MIAENTGLDGVILAAGMGIRLRSSDSPLEVKPLVKVKKSELLLRTINSLEIAGCQKIIIITGWKADRLEYEITREYHGPLPLQFVFNKEYELKNGVSALCARNYVENNFVLTMADHILDKTIMLKVKNYQIPPQSVCLCVDYKLDSIFDMDDATKVLERGGKIVKIGKEIKEYNCIDTGVFICTDMVFDALDEQYRQNGDVSLSEGIQLIADRGQMAVLDIEDAFWQDVDTPEMLAHAESLLKAGR